MTELAEQALLDRPHRRRGAGEAWFLRINQALVIGMMAIMVALVFANVVSRYVFGYSIIWAEELSQYLMVWIAFIGAGLALREGRHVAVELLQDRVSAVVRRIIRTLVAALLAAFFVAVAILGFRFAHFAIEQETPVLNISLAIPYLCVPLGALLLLGHLCCIRREYIAGNLDIPETLESSVEEEDR